MFGAIKRDYPNLPKFMIDWTLDLYAKNPDYFKDLERNENKRQRKKRTPAVPTEVIELEPVKVIDRDEVGSLQEVLGEECPQKVEPPRILYFDDPPKAKLEENLSLDTFEKLTLDNINV